MDPETCIIMPPEVATVLMDGDLLAAAVPTTNWTMILAIFIAGLMIVEAVRLGFVLWRDFY